MSLIGIIGLQYTQMNSQLAMWNILPSPSMTILSDYFKCNCPNNFTRHKLIYQRKTGAKKKKTLHSPTKFHLLRFRSDLLACSAQNTQRWGLTPASRRFKSAPFFLLSTRTIWLSAALRRTCNIILCLNGKSSQAEGGTIFIADGGRSISSYAVVT